MAEGFGRYWPADFAKFLTIARASLMETHNSAGSGFKKGYFTTENTDKMQRSRRGPRTSRTPRTPRTS